MLLDGTPGAAAGSEGAAASNTDEFNTPLAALEGLFDASDDDDKQSGASAPDAGTEETPSTGDEEGQSETPAEQPASIEPPNSWSADEKALFAKLPPEAQALVARRESDRDKVVLQRTQEAAEAKKAAEAERTAVQAQRQAQLQSLDQLMQLVLPEAKAFENIDWQRLSVENPAEYVRLSAARDQLRGRVQRLQAEQERVRGEAKAEHDKRLQGILAEQRQKLVEKIPEFADDAKAVKLRTDLSQHLQSAYGFSPQEIGQTVDHRLVMVGVDAMKWRQHQAALKVAETKRQNTPPRVQPAGSPQGSDDTASRRIKGKVDRFGQSNSVRDAASLLMEVLD